MLRITPSTNAAGAAKYFDEGLRRADYFAAEEHSIGTWGGRAAERLGLSGEVNKEDFVALCHNTRPDGSKLNPRHSESRKVGYDFTFSVPKSASVAYAVTGDERIRLAFEQSVEETMAELEKDMRTQTGQGKDKAHAVTGEMAWASFTHRTSRPVDGIPDPHLHRHCFALNTTWNEAAGRFQAGEFGPIKQAAPYYEAAFDSRMAHKMRGLGYEVERRGLSWEVKGMEDDLLQKFSRRTSQIEETASKEKAANGGISAKQKEKLGALTRAKKAAGETWDKLREIWKSWLTKDEADRIERSRAEAAVEKKNVEAGEAVERAQQHLFERKSVVREHQLKAEALKRGFGDFLPEDVEAAIDGGRFHRQEVGGQQLVTTEEAVREEQRMLAHLREGRGKAQPINPAYEPKDERLNDEQRAAIRHALTDTGTVTLISGGAGTGKTTLVREIRDGIEEKGLPFVGVAPSAAASRGVMREEGFDKADTLAQLLASEKMQQQARNGVIWVDEAGLIGNRDMNRLFEIAKQQNARLLLTGDTRQHSSVAAGDALRILEEEGGLKTARVRQIQRQSGNPFYKNAVQLAGEGRGDAALYQLDRIGDVVEMADDRERLGRLVDDYAEATRQGKSVLVVSPTHAEGREVTEALRQRLQSEGQVGKEERPFTRLEGTNWTEENKADAWSYRQAQGRELVLEFHQNAPGHQKGERWKIAADRSPALPGVLAATDMKGTDGEIPLDKSGRFTVYRQEKISLAQGDKIRVTKGGQTREGTRVNTGDTFTVKGFDRDGHLRLHTGKTLDRDFGHIAYGYATTSHSSQGKTVDQVFIAQSSKSLPASSQQQFYVSISRGRERARVYTDDKKALEQAVKQDSQRMTAREIANRSRLQRAQVQAKEAAVARQKTANQAQKDHAKRRNL